MLSAAQYGANAGEQFAVVEWLGQVVIGASFQTIDSVLTITTGDPAVLAPIRTLW